MCAMIGGAWTKLGLPFMVAQNAGWAGMVPGHYEQSMSVICDKI